MSRDVYLVLVPFVAFHVVYRLRGGSFVAGGIFPKSPALAFWCVGCALQSLAGIEAGPLVVLSAMIPFALVQSVFAREGRRFFTHGLLPVVAIAAIVIVGQGLGFPGLCDSGDGIHCVGPGLYSYVFDLILRIDSGWSPLIFIFYNFTVFPFLILVATILTMARKEGALLRGAAQCLLLLGAAGAIYQAMTVEWEPKFVEGGNRHGYCQEGACEGYLLPNSH